MEQTVQEWLSNHPRRFFIFFPPSFIPLSFLLYGPAVLPNAFGGPARKHSGGRSVWGGDGGEVIALCWPLGWEEGGKRHSARCHDCSLFISLFAEPLSSKLSARTLPF